MSSVRIHAVHEDLVYLTHGRELFVGAFETGFEHRSQLPLGPLRRVVTDGLTSPVAQSLLNHTTGRFATFTLVPVDRERIILTRGRSLLVSTDGGRTWTNRHRLPPSSPPFGVLPSAICEHDGQIIVGEYPQDSVDPPRLLLSEDNGVTWRKIPIQFARHIHAVQSDPFGDHVWITTGDTDSESRILRLVDGILEPIGGGSQDWRAVELAFTPEAILWGVDCPYVQRNHVYILDRDDIDDAAPTRVHSVDGSVFFAETVKVDDHWHVAFSTAVETGVDSSSPERTPYHANGATVFVSSSASRYREWEECCRLRRRRVLFDQTEYTTRYVSSAYLFLHAYDGAFLVNPFNTQHHDGSILRVSVPPA